MSFHVATSSNGVSILSMQLKSRVHCVLCAVYLSHLDKVLGFEFVCLCKQMKTNNHCLE